MTIHEDAAPPVETGEVAAPPAETGEVAAPAVETGAVTAPARPGPPPDAPPPPVPATGEPGSRTPPDRVDAPTAALFEAAQAIPRALQIAGSVVAPTTLLTALFFYFGLLYAVAYYRWFGVNYTVLDVPAQGYFIVSVSTAILPLAIIAGVALFSLWIYQLPLEALSGRPRLLVHRVLHPLVGGTGLLLVGAAAMDALFGVVLYPPRLLEARGVSLAGGLLLLGYAGRLRRVLGTRRRAPAAREAPVALTVTKWGSFCLLVGVGLFWAVGSYAIRMGSEGARGLAASLQCAPDVVLYSEKSLNLGSSGLRQEGPAGADSAYGFRYAGLKLVPQSGDRYLLVPADWRPGGRPAIVLARSDAVRLEFVVRAPPPPGC